MTTPQNNDPNYDPLASALKRPAVSWKNHPINKVKRLTVQSLAREAQTTDFATKQPAFWPDGNKKMAAVFDVQDEETGEELALWAPKPSSLLTALAVAQTDAGQRVGPGGVLEVFISGTKPSGKGNDQNLFKAKYTPPAAGANTPDPLAGASQPSQPADSDPWSTPAASEEPPF